MRTPLLLLSLILTCTAMASPQVRVLALFKDKALLEIDGNRRLLEAGKTSPEGVELISSSGLRAKIQMESEEHILEPQSRIGSQYAAPISKEYRILRDNSGHFRASGTINGQPVNFLVDTGASNVAMSEIQARNLGIPYQKIGTPGLAQTASGTARSYLINLDSVSIGNIKLNNVQGSVIEGGHPPQVLLGMSFLNGLELRNQSNVLLLIQKH